MNPISFPRSNFLVYELETAHDEGHDKTTALLLSISGSFYEDVRTAGGSITVGAKPMAHIDGLINRGRLPLWFHFGFDEHLLGKEYAVINNAAQELLGNYNLGDRWLPSIKLLLVKDYLVLPVSSPATMRVGTENVVAETYLGDSQIIVKKRIIGRKKTLRLDIELTERVSRRQLTDLINQSPELDWLLGQLPTPKKSRINLDSESTYWGYRAWEVLTYENPDLSWRKLEDLLDEREPEKVAPEWAALRTYYMRFLETLKYFER